MNIIQFAETTSGIGALGLNVQGFVFQLITFVVVLLLLRKYVYGRLVDTLEARRQAVLESLAQADASAKQLAAAEKEVTALIKEARTEAESIVDVAHKEAAKMVEEAEDRANKKADHIVEAAQTRLAQDVLEAREVLRKDTAKLVAAATEKVLRQKLDGVADAKLIEKALKEAR